MKTDRRSGPTRLAPGAGCPAKWFRVLASAALIGLLAAPTALAGPSTDEFRLVPEMEDPEGIVVQPRRERDALQDQPDADRGLARLRRKVTELWPSIREVDLAELSRYHVEQTRGFELPATPGELVGRALAHDSGLWYLELRGPRLPARFDIVYRFLYVFASFDPATGEIDQLTVTIRGWVLE